MRVLKSAHLGFTITELMIVFSIIAMLTLLSATALQSANKDNIVDEATQQILNGIRETQNRAVGVSSGNSGETVRAWSIKIKEDGTGYTIYKYNEVNGTYLVESVYGDFTFNNNIIVSTSLNDTIQAPLYVAYNIPFGRAFLSFSEPCTCDATCQAESGNKTGCKWVESSRYEKDWEIVDGVSNVVSMKYNKISTVKINVSFKNNPNIKKTISISAAGDASVE